METAVLKGTRRSKIGTRYARRLRAAGQLPAIIYGHGETPESIALPAHDTGVELHHGARILEVDLEGAKTQYLIKAVQYDHLGSTPVHLDLMRVDFDEQVTVQVAIETRGTPKGLADGGVLELIMPMIEVRCAVNKIPETIRPNVTDLGVNDSLLIGDLEMGEGVVPIAAADEKVATVRLLAEEAEAEETPEGEEEAQPEVIGRPKKDDEPAEGSK
ncbi:MAG: 50S ribosomal protein L25 [bacterium]|nr:50S ribosomal protein L25 [bacterium]